ncbi:ABC transporter permease [Paenibacillus hexagrammi]|uniref:ABC transporter permease subunit n=1 Tax=Paenibacillus hexagrammi TaxID=2908839 RepID=A0ABY3SRV9_9BACL|nr:ABC transporter permease subunit [Paenibacillus sp. YPD9-1]UJF36409.1 ABC transporter permease subunit [Paenibacillus sp. YPD9-1]
MVGGGWQKDLAKNKYLYMLLLPGILYFVIFKYVPMWGVTIAFQDFNMFKGYWNSPWVGLDHFTALFKGVDFGQKFWNTLMISLLKLVFGFPVPIVLALLLNELRLVTFKKVTQTILYLPHFVSWVVLSGIMVVFLNPGDGLINGIIQWFGGTSIDFLNSTEWFRTVLVVSDIYKGAGWGTVVYLAAISNVDPQLYEAATMDGASTWQKMWRITLPSIKSVIIVLGILSLGGIMSAGFEQILLLYNPIVYPVGDVIDTYVYRRGIISADYSLAMAADVFKSLIALILISGTNWLAKRFGEEAVW